MEKKEPSAPTKRKGQKTRTVRSSSVVRANKGSGSGLPGAAQRARSRQRGATLEAQLRLALRLRKAAKDRNDWYTHCILTNTVTRIRRRLKAKASRRPFGANGRTEVSQEAH